MSGGVGMLVGYDIGGGGFRLFDGERLRVSDDGDLAAGSYRRRRSSGASGPPRGRLDRRAWPARGTGPAGAGRAAAARRPRATLARGPGFDRGAGRPNAGRRLGDLVTAARALTDAMTEHPAAALALSVAGDWRSATLRSVGPEGLAVAAEPLTVEVAAWSGY